MGEDESGWQREANRLKDNHKEDSAAVLAFMEMFEHYLPAVTEGKKQPELALLCLGIHHVGMRFRGSAGKKGSKIMHVADLYDLPEAIYPSDRLLCRACGYSRDISRPECAEHGKQLVR